MLCSSHFIKRSSTNSSKQVYHNCMIFTTTTRYSSTRNRRRHDTTGEKKLHGSQMFLFHSIHPTGGHPISSPKGIKRTKDACRNKQKRGGATEQKERAQRQRHQFTNCSLFPGRAERASEIQQSNASFQSSAPASKTVSAQTSASSPLDLSSPLHFSGSHLSHLHRHTHTRALSPPPPSLPVPATEASLLRSSHW